MPLARAALRILLVGGALEGQRRGSRCSSCIISKMPMRPRKPVPVQ